MHRLSGRILLIAAAFALFLVPVAAIAAGGFTDVDDDSVFKADIAWLADAGVTKGCNPPTNDEFCPEGNVTREQMAAFMHRLAVNKVVDAATAVDADNLDGKDSTAFAVSGHDHDADYLAISGTAADADLFDGKDSTDFALANAVPGLASTSKTIHDFTATESVAGSVELSYPAAGVIYVTVEGYQECPAGIIYQRIVTDNLSDASWYLASIADGTPTGYSNQYTWVVDSAGTTRFFSSGYSTGGPCTGFGGVGNFVAMYFPTTYGSVASAELSSGVSGQPQP